MRLLPLALISVLAACGPSVTTGNEDGGVSPPCGRCVLATYRQELASGEGFTGEPTRLMYYAECPIDGDCPDLQKIPEEQWPLGQCTTNPGPVCGDNVYIENEPVTEECVSCDECALLAMQHEEAGNSFAGRDCTEEEDECTAIFCEHSEYNLSR